MQASGQDRRLQKGQVKTNYSELMGLKGHSRNKMAANEGEKNFNIMENDMADAHDNANA